MLNGEILQVIDNKVSGYIKTANVLFFDLNGNYEKVVDFSLSPSLSDGLSECEKRAALNAEFIYNSYGEGGN